MTPTLFGYVIENPIPNYTLNNSDSNLVLSRDEESKEKILQVLNTFSLDQYDAHNVPGQGLFFIEKEYRQDGIKDILRASHPWEHYLTPYINTYAKPGTIALDIGAHIGTHTINLARAVGENGKVIAFEPQPKTFSELFMNCRLNGLNNVSCFWGALGDKNEDLELPNFYPGFEVVYLYDFRFGHSGQTAPMTTLDSLKLTNVSFIKVDVDGCDDIFLEGAKETILNNRPVILMEIMGGIDFDTATPDIKEKILYTQQLLADLRYQLFRVSVFDYLAIPY